jgi:hypothetical protein
MTGSVGWNSGPVRLVAHLLVAVAVVHVGVGCSEGADDTGGAEGAEDGVSSATSEEATVIPDDLCRNNAIAVGEAREWLLADHLPLDWRGRSEVVGEVQEIEPGRHIFVADGIQLEVAESTTGPGVCIPWDEPQVQE